MTSSTSWIICYILPYQHGPLQEKVNVAQFGLVHNTIKMQVALITGGLWGVPSSKDSIWAIYIFICIYIWGNLNRTKMLTAISSPTTRSFYFNILKDYLSLLLVSNIARFLIMKADSFSVSAVCQLQLFEVNTHIFMGFSPSSQTSKLSKWGELCTALFPCTALEHWHTWTRRSWEQR